MLLTLAMLLTTHIALPAAFIIWLWVPGSRAFAGWLMKAFYGGAYVMFITLCGQWDWLTHHLRLGLPIVFLLSVIVTGLRARRFPWLKAAGPSFLRRHGFTGVMTFVFFGMSAYALTGYDYEPPAVDLAFPFREGTFAVRHGGDNTLINYHNSNRGQRFALDVVALDPLGRRARGLYPSDLARYAIYGRDVTSPCTGVALSIRNDLDDNIPPAADVADPAGNHIVLACGTARILLAHFQKGSIEVAEGALVQEGQPLGRVGNSGNSSEPHLHIHAYQGNGDFDDGIGVPITFGGRFLVRGSTVTVP